MLIYHVAREYNGYDLMSMLTQVERGLISQEDAIGAVIATWPDIYIGYDADSDEARDLAWEYILIGDGREVHCHATFAEAVSYRSDCAPGGVILAVDTDGLDVRIGAEYPHPVVLDTIPASHISPTTC